MITRRPIATRDIFKYDVIAPEDTTFVEIDTDTIAPVTEEEQAFLDAAAIALCAADGVGRGRADAQWAYEGACRLLGVRRLLHKGSR